MGDCSKEVIFVQSENDNQVNSPISTWFYILEHVAESPEQKVEDDHNKVDSAKILNAFVSSLIYLLTNHSTKEDFIMHDALKEVYNDDRN